MGNVSPVGGRHPSSGQLAVASQAGSRRRIQKVSEFVRVIVVIDPAKPDAGDLLDPVDRADNELGPWTELPEGRFREVLLLLIAAIRRAIGLPPAPDETPVPTPLPAEPGGTPPPAPF